MNRVPVLLVLMFAGVVCAQDPDNVRDFQHEVEIAKWEAEVARLKKIIDRNAQSNLEMRKELKETKAAHQRLVDATPNGASIQELADMKEKVKELTDQNEQLRKERNRFLAIFGQMFGPLAQIGRKEIVDREALFEFYTHEYDRVFRKARKERPRSGPSIVEEFGLKEPIVMPNGAAWLNEVIAKSPTGQEERVKELELEVRNLNTFIDNQHKELDLERAEQKRLIEMLQKWSYDAVATKKELDRVQKENARLKAAKP